ncbi:glycosyltransferase family 4 protein [Bacteroides gallinaceum]|uniref:Glycosyltransferase family 4 protein n=1 Tax=Bacteroides gallinaceum TaxID=1462571 RepID=A0ABT7VKD2_9BACE|nr:glycosyltransferase family 4 protein [Bacteroides gallinaceum]MDM8326140.1 glycosyltransferase family 4 protein [Bacteroides gallinaceum]
MKKLLFCTSNFKTGVGGISSYAFDFINAFKAEFNITIIASGNIENNTYKVYQCNYLDFSIANANRLLDIINKEQPDIIINSAFALLSLVTPYINNTIKIITVSHFVNGRYAWFAGLNGNYVDSIISLSSYGKEYIQKKFSIKDEQKIKVVFNFMPETPPNYKEKEKKQTLKIVYPGGCSYAKSAEVVCKSLKLLLKTTLDFEFYWIGNTKIAGGNNKFIQIKDIKDCLPKDKRIKQIGRVERSVSKKILSEANIFLLPSRGEGFPISLIEAMRFGCIPIISNAKHGSLDAITNGINGLIVRQSDADSIVNQISNIIKKHSDYYSIYENSYYYYKNNLTESIWKNKLSQIIQLPLNHSPRISIFNKYRYKKDKLYIQYLMNKYWIYDRCIQLYHFLYFRYLKYFI